MLTKSKVILCAIITMVTATVECTYSGCESQKISTSLEKDNEITECNIVETKEDTFENIVVEDTVTETKIEIDNEADAVEVIKPISLGNFKLTAYCSCEKCCGIWSINRPIDEYGNEIVYGSIGEVLRAGYSIATDPDVIPYNSKVMINGQIYEVQDCGGAIKQNRIDVYYSSHQDAVNFGIQYAEVFLLP